MLKTIFNLGEPSRLPALCAVGECLDPDTGSCRTCRSPENPSRTNWWATGILIHPRVVLTVAHSPRSGTVLGDRIVLPEMKCAPVPSASGEVRGVRSADCFPERVLCVQRIHDHPKSSQRGYDARLLILMDIDDIEEELERRRCQLEECDPKKVPGFHIDGFMNLTEPPPSLPTRSRAAARPANADDEETHGHVAHREFVISPETQAKAKSSDRTAAFGDSGAPVWIDGAGSGGKARVVGMYVRRSLNRPAMGNPDLVILQWKKDLKDWVNDVMDRHGLELEP